MFDLTKLFDLESHGGPRRLLVIALLVGLVVRLAILGATPALGTEIMDEQQYSQIARSLVAGDGFSWGPGRPTSIRPPLYPWLLAAAWGALGSESLQAVRLLQILLALATTGLVYLLGSRVYGPRVGAIAAALFWLYPSLLFFNFLILTETLFTFLMVAFVLFSLMLVRTPRAWTAIACGATLGLAALTRSIMWPLPILLCPLLAVMIRGAISRRIALPALVLVAFAIVVGPWAVRNTRLQSVVTIVDTMGGINLRMGNYECTPDDRMWDAVALTGEKSWVYGLEVEGTGPVTEGQKDKWAQRKAVEYMLDHPGQTVRRSFIKFADFWGLEREFIAGVRGGLFDVPLWFEIVATATIVLGYVAVVVAGAAGIWLAAPADWRMQVLLLLPIVLIMGLHTIVFGHSRYHLPLIPILAVYGAALVAARPLSLSDAARGPLVGAAVSVAALGAIWVRQVVLVDLNRIASLLDHGN